MLGVARTDPQGRHLAANDRYGQIAGRSREQLLDLTVRQLTHPEDLPALDDAFQRLVREGGDLALEARWLRPDGSSAWVEIVAISGGEPAAGDLWIVRDVTARKLAEQELRDAARRKDEFLGALGHELRNPLAPILSANEAMRLAGPRDPGLDRMREIIDRQVRQMARVLDDLVDVSRIGSGRFVVRRGRVDLAELARQTVRESAPQFEQARLDLRDAILDEPLWIHGDRPRLEQVLEQLLRQARESTGPGGRIEVRLSRDPAAGQAVLCVRDTGAGIAPERVGRVFDAFLPSGRPSGASGDLGLGLALVRGLVRLHGGAVTARSEGEGKGSEFEVRLPLDAATAPETPAPPGRARPRSHRVLIIEDNEDSAESLCTALRLRGHQASVAYSGAEGLEKARQLDPEVVLCDIGLPGEMDGYAVASALRRDLMLGSALLIALTGYGQDEDRRQAMQAGFDLYLRKPVAPAELERIIAERAG